MIKHTDVQLERVANNITRVKEYLSELNELQATDTTTFWKALKKIIVKAKTAHTEKIMDILKQKDILPPENSHLDMKFLGGAVAAYDEVLNMVDRNTEVCDEANARLHELKENYEKIKTNIELQ
jgi:hypothetical protein